MSENNTVIKAENLHKSYGDNHVLQGIDFSVKRGTILALLGPNGAGKTTTVRILSTLLSLDDGKVSVEGHDVVKDAEAVRSVIGLTGQSAAVDELLTGRENLVMMGRLYHLTPTSANARAQELLEEFDLVEAADRSAKTYSGGMRRRLDLAVSLIASPPVIFLDEPTTGLDPRSRLVMWDIINKLKENNTTILLTTQYLDEADQLADDIIVIDDGKIIASGTPKQLKSKLGKDRLVLSFDNPAKLDAAFKAVDKPHLVVDREQLQLSVPIESTGADVRQILDALDTSGIAVTTMDIHKPTLDDVFMTVTDKTKPNSEKQDN